jgi:multidrug resistance efflux pump
MAGTRSPLGTDGAVVDLRINTVGGVVTPGQVLLDILASDYRLIVEARVGRDDIDSAETGLPARVVITALNQRDTVPLQGTVSRVSADRLADPRLIVTALFWTRRARKAPASGNPMTQEESS